MSEQSEPGVSSPYEVDDLDGSGGDALWALDYALDRELRAVDIRRERVKAFDGYYRKIGKLRDGCWYCGAKAHLHWDHVPALSVLGRSGMLPTDFLCVKVPACHDCNMTLGAIPVAALDRRATWLSGYARRLWVAASVGSERWPWSPSGYKPTKASGLCVSRPAELYEEARIWLAGHEDTARQRADERAALAVAARSLGCVDVVRLPLFEWDGRSTWWTVVDLSIAVFVGPSARHAELLREGFLSRASARDWAKNWLGWRPAEPAGDVPRAVPLGDAARGLLERLARRR